MFANKYSNFLTILLIVLIVIILVVGGYFVYVKFIKPYTDGKNIEQAMAQFDTNSNNVENTNITDDDFELMNFISEESPEGKKIKKSYYKSYVMLGYIEIPKTKIKYPVLEETTVSALETSVAALYPSNATLNEGYNIVIIGHNYRNGKFFSNNKNLSVGDKIYITGNNGKLEYVIYQIFETTVEDTSFYARNTGGVPEITLSSCTDDGESRLIVLAKANS